MKFNDVRYVWSSLKGHVQGYTWAGAGDRQITGGRYDEQRIASLVHDMVSVNFAWSAWIFSSVNIS